MPLAATNCVGAVWWLCSFIGILSGCGAQADLRNGRSRQLRAWTGSVGGMTAVDVEDMAGDEPGLVRRDEHDAVGDLLRAAESTQRNLRRKGRLILRRAGEAGQHAGVRGAWRDGIHANSRLGDFERDRLGDAFDGVLGADVNRGESCTL